MLGSVFSICCTVACRLYRRGATTIIENIGGGVVVVGGETTGCKDTPAAIRVLLESTDPGDKGLSAAGDPLDGIFNFIAVVAGTVESGTKDDTEDRSERELADFAAADSSEPADETVGEPFP